ncbi:calcium-dependent protein kinase 26-like isoform X1 [Neltuma alba]|uniref:calcium-dependent protein kinase 26-like isoform X1 n=1 Tax=Neltuma alba TaxID=207710 RepID=UPI0010A52806|nr:calcium-dependent protein kinase 26-like isoform X1 [Prosopis alba]XP_028756354.1 calcium-dependent protein kinase 26-like isoform X1 [Prosopis alba]
MDVAKSNSGSEPSTSYSCFKVANLSETILDTKQSANLKDRYVLGEQLGWGQFGVIRACTDKLTGDVLACKSIAKDRLVTSDDLRSVKLEIEIMARLSGHPNVVDLKAVYEEEDFVHLVMELCAGGELFHRLEKNGRFSESEARVLFRHLMQVVLYCHENGVVHRDLKPENILLATRASSSPIKLADFGLATYIKPGQSLHGLVGSPFYIAPEVLAGSYDQAADVWSAGVILYILLSGMPPFWGKTKSQIFEAVKAADLRFPSEPWDHISKSAKDLIKGMLCTEPSRRLTAQQVLDHCWMESNQTNPEQLIECDIQSCGEWDVGDSSFSVPFMPRNQDISFGAESLACDAQSPTFTCRSSFSSFLMEPSTPCSALGGFSFQSPSDSAGLDFSSPVSSMPSFAFLSANSVVEKRSCTLEFSTDESVQAIVEAESSLGKLLLSPDSALCCGPDIKASNRKPMDTKRAGGNNGHRVLGIHSKRNRTIGLGEREQLDIVVTESIIRWSSCTQLPTSLRSSLVC